MLEKYVCLFTAEQLRLVVFFFLLVLYFLHNDTQLFMPSLVHVMLVQTDLRCLHSNIFLFYKSDKYFITKTKRIEWTYEKLYTSLVIEPNLESEFSNTRWFSSCSRLFISLDCPCPLTWQFIWIFKPI